jgi:phosphatidylinositol 4-phosphatase
MKRFLSKISKMPQKLPRNPSGSVIDQVQNLTPHPDPYNHIALAVAADGIILKQYDPSSKETGEYVRIRWTGKPVKGGVHVEVLDTQVDVNWQESIIVYGIVGILELFSSAFVIQNKQLANLTLQQHRIY